MKPNDCGHPITSEESVLRCTECEAEARRKSDDALWNAAIEAALGVLNSIQAGSDPRAIGLHREVFDGILKLKRTTPKGSKQP